MGSKHWLGSAIAFLCLHDVAMASDIKILATAAWPALIREVTPEFEKATGGHLVAEFTGPAELGRRVKSGESFDVVLTSAASVDDFARADLVGTPIDMGVAHTVVAYRKGAPAPEAATVDDVGKLVRRASKIAYSDPASGAGTSLYFIDIVKKAGLEDELRAKAVVVGPAKGGIPVGQGTAEFGIALTCEVAELKDVAAVRLVPSDPRDTIAFAAGLSRKAPNPEGARAALAFFASSKMKDEMLKSGFAFDR